MLKKLTNYFDNACKKTNVKSIILCKFGLEFSLGLIIIAIVLSLLNPQNFNYVITQNYIEYLIESSMACVFISFFVPIILEAALFDKQKNEN